MWDYKSLTKKTRFTARIVDEGTLIEGSHKRIDGILQSSIVIIGVKISTLIIPGSFNQYIGRIPVLRVRYPPDEFI